MTEAMGGTVGAEQSSLGGLRIEVDLPTAEAAPAEPARSEAVAR
jgi:hypothetical protein